MQHEVIQLEDVCTQEDIEAMERQAQENKHVIIEWPEQDATESNVRAFPKRKKENKPAQRVTTYQLPKAKKQVADEQAMKNAKQWLEERKIPYLTPSQYQLKIGPINFYPQRGSITIDGVEGKCKEKGLEGLRSILLRMCSGDG